MYNIFMNFFTFIFDAIAGSDMLIIRNLAKILSKGGGGVRKSLSNSAKQAIAKPKYIKSFIQEMIKNPSSLAKGLTKLNPKELAELNEAIDKARDGSLKAKNTLTSINESKALSSTWLIHAHYVGNKVKGEITITTIQGKSYNFPVPISYITWEKMKNTRGRAGSGAGSIFHRDYWNALRSKKAKVKTNIVFKLAGIK